MKWTPLFLTQLIAMMTTIVDISTTFMAQKYNLVKPSLIVSINYMLITILILPALIYLKKPSGIYVLLKSNILSYMTLGLLAYGAVFLFTIGLSHTYSFNSMLINNLTTPISMIISIVVLKSRYRLIQYLGIAFVILGALILFFVKNDHTPENYWPIWGDLSVFLSCFLFALNGIYQEKLLKSNHQALEILGGSALFSFVFSFLQLYFLNNQELSTFDLIELDSMAIVLIILIIVFNLLSTLLIPYTISKTSATFYNTSYIFVNLYVLVIGSIIFKDQVQFLYYVCFSFVILGLVLYIIEYSFPFETKEEENDGKLSA